MATNPALSFLAAFLFVTFSHTTSAMAAQSSCASYTFSGNHAYPSCTSLPHLGATLHYNYTPSTHTIAVAFRAPPPQGETGWVAWGLNPNGTGMVGSQAVVAFQRSGGGMAAYPTRLDSYAPSMAPAEAGELSFPVSGAAAEYVGKEMVVYATVALPAGAGSEFHHVWQVGSAVATDGTPSPHPTAGENILSMGTIDFSK